MNPNSPNNQQGYPPVQNQYGGYNTGINNPGANNSGAQNPGSYNVGYANVSQNNGYVQQPQVAPQGQVNYGSPYGQTQSVPSGYPQHYTQQPYQQHPQQGYQGYNGAGQYNGGYRNGTYQPQYAPAHPQVYQGNYPAAYQPYAYSSQPSPTKAASSDSNKMFAVLSIMTGLMIILQMLIVSVYNVLGINLYGSTEAYYWLTTVLAPLSTLLPSVIYLAASKRNLNQYIYFENRDALANLLAIFGGLSICLLANIPANLVRGFFEGIGFSSSSYEPSGHTPMSIIVYVVGIAVLPPIMEEFVFRGFMLPSLEKHGTGFAIVTTAIIFGLAHVQPASIVFATIAGLVFGYLYVKTRNLWVCVIVHMLNNALSVFLSFSYDIFGEGNGDMISNIIFYGLVIFGLICLLFLFIFKRKTFFAKEPKPYGVIGYNERMQPIVKLNASQSAAAIVRTPMMWVFVGFVIIEMIITYALV